MSHILTVLAFTCCFSTLIIGTIEYTFETFVLAHKQNISYTTLKNITANEDAECAVACSQYKSCTGVILSKTDVELCKLLLLDESDVKTRYVENLGNIMVFLKLGKANSETEVSLDEFTQKSAGYFLFRTTAETGFDAIAKCQEFGPNVYPAGLETDQKKAAVGDLMLVGGGCCAWIGAVDKENTDEFVFMGSNTPVPSDLWRPDHPKHGMGNCAFYNIVLGRIETGSCRDHQLPYVCEVYPQI